MLEATGQLALDVQEGNLSAPQIRPTTSAVAGGVAGTLLFGPGLGTAVGVKAGEVFRKASGWFKKKDGEEGDDAETQD